MGNYGDVTILAAYAIKEGLSPREAWEKAVKKIKPTVKASQPCPRSAFLTLCSEGHILHCPKGQYTHSTKNKKYILDALEYIQRHPDATNLSPRTLWEKLGHTTGYKEQMHVLLYLHKEGILI